LEHQLANAKARCEDFEDTVMQLERDKLAHDRQLEAIRLQLDAESSKRAKLEQLMSRQKSELAMAKDRAAKFEADLKKVWTDLRKREWEVKQLESRQDKTIVEHVHVLEEAKKLTDRELENARLELEKNAAYIRSLEKAKSRLAGEAEDTARERERERVELRSKEKAARSLEEKATRALTDIEQERRAREAAENQSRRLQQQLLEAQDQLVDLSQEVNAVQRSKDNLEMELARLADETDAPNSLAKLQRQYESRIAQLEGQLDEAHGSQVAAIRIKEQIDRHHAELRNLIESSGSTDDAFRSRLLRELQHADQQFAKEMSSRSHPRDRQGSEVHTMANAAPRKSPTDVTPRSRRTSQHERPRNLDQQVNALKTQVQVLELRMAASDRVRRHLEVSLRDMTAELENSDGSKQFLQRYRARLSQENTRLGELLQDEMEARRAAEAAQMDGVQAMWSKFQRTMEAERETYFRLEESRKALVRAYVFFPGGLSQQRIKLVQQRALQGEAEAFRGQTREAVQSKKLLQAEMVKIQERLSMEIAAKNEEQGESWMRR
jgi:myosin protein heavy chain